MEIKPYYRKPHFYETDQMGIIHHSNYIRWFEEARVDWMAQLGMTVNKLREEGIILPIAGVECDYRSMVRFGDEICITIAVTQLTGAKMAVEYTVKDTATGELRATGRTRHGFLNAEGRPVSLKRVGPEYYERICGLMAPPETRKEETI